jgi:uncharacterized protein (TIRG00374 family)
MAGDERSATETIEPDRLTEVESEESLLLEDERAASMFSRRNVITFIAGVVLLIGGVYVLLPQVLDLQSTLGKVGEGDPGWIAAALGFNVVSFIAYVALFRGVVGEQVLHLDWRESYEITMAGLAATRLFSAGGAGGIVLTYWALRKAGMPRRRSVCRMVAFLVLLYAVYMLSLIVFGVLLRTGVLNGPNSVGLTIVPAGIAGALILIFLAVSLVPEDLERRLAAWARGYRRSAKTARKLATVPVTLAQGTRTAISFARQPSQGGLAIAGAVGFWAANIGVLWASFHAFDAHVPLGVVIQGFFIGMTANLLPVPGGVGSVDGGMIGAFVLFGFPAETVFAAVLTYRVIAFWLPIPPGIVAYFQLRRTVHRWEAAGIRAEPEASPAGN